MILNREKPAIDNRTKLIGESLYNNYLYQLYLIEFINYLDKERNWQFRNKIKETITSTKLKKNVIEFNKEMRQYLENYPRDLKLMNDLLGNYYLNRITKEELINTIDSTVFDFDRKTINKLRLLNHADLKKELLEISNHFTIQKEFDTKEINFPNIYMPCSDLQEKTGYCDKSKLIINTNIEPMVDILIQDLKNNLRSKYLFEAAFADIIVHPFNFAQWPTEVITIYRIN